MATTYEMALAREKALESERDALRAELAAAQKRIAQLEDANRWRKWPEEKPPTNNGDWLIDAADGIMITRHFIPRLWDSQGVRHWRPITPPTA